MLSKILHATDEKRAELVRCEGRGVGSASERRQQDRIVGFEGKWAHLRFQGKTLHSGTMMRIQHELTERSLLESSARAARRPYPGMLLEERVEI